MPYIRQEARDELKEGGGLAIVPMNVGELNYCLTTIINRYWSFTRNYQAINDVLGALEGAKLEFYRRAAVPYEEKAIERNGDLYVS